MAKPTSKSGRLVWNHSTHINGLIPILERLCNQDSIQTITPGEIRRVRGSLSSYAITSIGSN